MDFDAEGLLDGLEGEEREARAQLLQELAEDGCTVDELRAAVAEDRLALLSVERVLGGRLTAAEIEERTGVPANLMLRIRRLLGLPEIAPEERAFGEEDIAAAEATRGFIDAGLGVERIMEITRVLGEAMARVAATTASAFTETYLKAGDNELELAHRFAAQAKQLAPAVAPVLSAAYNAHLREAVRRGVVNRAERESGQLEAAQPMAVCFADLVGFTRLGGEVDPSELGLVAGKLSELASEVTKSPARVVKTIGDAAMFVSPKAEPLVDAALSLVEAGEREELPSMRAGIAWGPALQRAGDYYGHSVNLASRVTGVARPGSVLCTEEIRDAAPDAFAWSFAGQHEFKGIREPLPLYRARRLGDEPPTKPKADRRRRRAAR